MMFQFLKRSVSGDFFKTGRKCVRESVFVLVCARVFWFSCFPSNNKNVGLASLLLKLSMAAKMLSFAFVF